MASTSDGEAVAIMVRKADGTHELVPINNAG